MKSPDVTYVLRPGNIRSKIDGDMHYISGVKLANLYGLNGKNCIIVEYDDRTFREKPGVKYIYLGPRSDGDYRLPEEREEKNARASK